MKTVTADKLRINLFAVYTINIFIFIKYYFLQLENGIELSSASKTARKEEKTITLDDWHAVRT